ncbi:MAG: class I SAM-dependent methyltransferase [Firmicutes bacterium]|nr:class I SAM-dependent methyltransferase [Bacillota bacterium]
MIEKQEVISFFNKYAVGWDSDMKRNDRVIAMILDNAGVREGSDVLDVACGTGVLFPDYLSRNVGFLTAIDISPEMAKIAGGKAALVNRELVIKGEKPIVNIICGDVEIYDFGKQFDSVVVYNAFPHFHDPKFLIERLAEWTKPGGRMTIAHGMSRETLLAHHSGSASKVSNPLMSAEELAELFKPYYDVDVIISDDRMYQVAGIRTDRS